MDYSNMLPQEVKKLIRKGEIDFQTSGMCNGYAQANLCILPKDYAFDFLLFCMRNPKPCPILEVGDVGSKQFNGERRRRLQGLPEIQNLEKRRS